MDMNKLYEEQGAEYRRLVAKEAASQRVIGELVRALEEVQLCIKDNNASVCKKCVGRNETALSHAKEAGF